MLELQGAATGLLDDPLLLRVRGLGGDDRGVTWRARLRDDDGRVWRATAERSQDLLAALAPAKAPAGATAALRSLRPVRIDVRAEAPDGRAAARTVTRLLAGDGVRIRRWRGVLPGAARATLHLPARDVPCATVLLAAAAGNPAGAVAAALAAPLLASRGVLVLTVADAPAERTAADPAPDARTPTPPTADPAPHARTPTPPTADPAPHARTPTPPTADATPAPRSDLLDHAVQRLAAVPGAAAPQRIVRVVPLLPPGAPAIAPGDPQAWDALLDRLGATPRAVAAES